MARPGIADPPTPVAPRRSGSIRREFKVEVVAEGALGTLVLGASKLPISKMEAVMNRYGSEGWDVAFMLVERKRYMAFWEREAAVITFSRELG